MNSEYPSIQHVTELPPEWLGVMAAMLARAFHRDPLFLHALPEESTRGQRLMRLFSLNIHYGMWYGEVYRADRHGLAIWLPPGGAKVTGLRALRVGMWRVPFEVGPGAVLRLARLNAVSERLHERLAGEPHWYLFQLGVDPGQQGGGLGRRLLHPVLERADAEGTPCYLETNNQRAVRFYQKLGFHVAAEDYTPALNLPHWAMRREPQPPVSGATPVAPAKSLNYP